MKNKFFILGTLTTALALGLVLAGCDTGGGDGDEEDGLNLPSINEETTGQNSITGSSIPLEADQSYDDITPAFVNGLNLPGETDNGVTWSVTNGKLTFSLGTPSQTSSLYAAVNSMGGWTNVQINPTEVEGYVVEGFEFSTGYIVARDKYETDGKTYARSSKIIYVYVSENVAASGQEETYEDDHVTTYEAFNYSLKKGWNLIQIDADRTTNGETRRIGIAAKNVPWTVTKT